MKKIFLLLIPVIFIIISCGSPNEPEVIKDGNNGYVIVSKFVTSGYAQDVIKKDSLLFVAQGEGGLVIINIKDPLKPKLVSEVISSLRGYSYKVANKDSVVFIAAGNFGVSAVDISDPYNPVVTVNNLPMKPARNLFVKGDYLFTAVSELGFNIADISFPTSPDVRTTTFTPGYAQSLVTTDDDNYLLVACGELGFAMMDISDFQDGFGYYPVAGWLDTPGYAVDVITHPTKQVAFLACGTGGLVIIDYADTLNLKILGSFNTGGYAKELAYKDNKIFVTTETRGLQIIDVSDLSKPKRIATVSTKYAIGVYVEDQYVYVADQQEGIVVVKMP
ncbi:MAG TPA: hypothetical protein PK073_09290 [Ignavibacteriaceae bacterium]|jgi:hypothetical protein|nr:MAG: LVIVD repeat protein [Ignavibacteria bacterium ADurb.Bin266]OQY72052.1 MAG: hypothetical protein B6D44_10830 [Ignavibacteriales bacterium UTCHB2]HQF43098.1 hypothetical protein [Ignavibacteriaceae bacterium]